MNAGGSSFVPRLFLHFFDRYHGRLARYSFRYPIKLIEREQRLAFRLAFLLSEELFLSGSAYFENPHARKILREHREVCEAGFVFLTARDLDVAEHFERKREFHYGDRSPADLQAAYRTMPRMPVLYKSAPIRTARTIRDLWIEAVDSGELIHGLDLEQDPNLPGNFEEIWAALPDALGPAAFVAPHVMQTFGDLGVRSPSELLLMRILDPGYTLSHAAALGCGLVADLMYLQTPWNVNAPHKGISYRSVRNKLIMWEILDQIEYAPVERLLALRLNAPWALLASSLNINTGRSYEDVTEPLEAMPFS